MKKRLFSIALSLCMVLALMPQMAFAETSGSTEDGFSYTISDAGEVTITGYTGSSSAVVIPGTINDNPVTAIGNFAFNECGGLTSINIPAGVTSIGNSAFDNCTSLESVIIPDSVTSIGSKAFYNCTNLKNVTIPEGVTYIGPFAFYKCKSLKSVIIPKGVKTICMKAFDSCTSLESIMFEEISQLTEIDIDAFYNCTSLERVIIPNGVIRILDAAFADCTSLESVEVPSSVSYADWGVFRGCTSLESIFLPNNVDASDAEIPDTASQVRYSLDNDKVTITEIELGKDKESVDIPETICGYPVVAVKSGYWEFVGAHTCKGGTATCTAKALCSICGEEYGELDSSNHSLDKIPAKDATVTETGNIEYWQCENCKKYFADEKGEKEISLEDTVIQKRTPEIIEGMDQSVTEGEKKALSFTSNAAYSDFIRVELDGSELSEENYEKAEGSIIITLDADYVATLPAGEHTIGIVSESGTAETTFTVEEKAAPGTSDDSDKDSKADAEDSAKTGDDTNLALWLALMLLSGAGITSTAVYTRRKRTNV